MVNTSNLHVTDPSLRWGWDTKSASLCSQASVLLVPVPSAHKWELYKEDSCAKSLPNKICNLFETREKLKKRFCSVSEFVFCEDLAGLTSCNILSPNWVILLACYWRCCWRSCWGPVQKSDQSMCWSDRKLVKALKPASPKSSTARWVMGKERMVWCDEWFWGSSVAGRWNKNGAQMLYCIFLLHRQWTLSGWTAFALLQSPAVSHFALVWSFSPLLLHHFHSLETVVACVCQNLSSVIFRVSVGFRSGSGIAVSLF